MKAIDNKTLDEWLFDYFEGNISVADQNRLTHYLHQHPASKADFDAWKNSYVNESEMIYSDTENLLQKTGYGKTGLKWWIGGLISIVLIIIYFFFQPTTSAGLKEKRKNPNQKMVLPVENVLETQSMKTTDIDKVEEKEKATIIDNTISVLNEKKPVTSFIPAASEKRESPNDEDQSVPPEDKEEMEVIEKNTFSEKKEIPKKGNQPFPVEGKEETNVVKKEAEIAQKEMPAPVLINNQETNDTSSVKKRRHTKKKRKKGKRKTPFRIETGKRIKVIKINNFDF